VASIFDEYDYTALSRLFHTPGYAGYRPDVKELPNGDGKVDVQKRYLHVALKYNPPEWALTYLARAHFEACRVAEAMSVPAEFYPRVADGTLRVLDYPAGAGSAEHTDFDLFTVHCYRSTWEPFERTLRMLESPAFERGLEINPGLHIGEIAEEIGLARAIPHLVRAAEYPQSAIVYFAMPNHNALLPSGLAVREWLRERIARSRVYT
jgi:hypothetical protein